MRHLLKTLIVLLLSTTLYSQEYKDYRSVGYVDLTGSYDTDTESVVKKPISGVYMSFMTFTNDETGVDILRIYTDAGSGEVTNDYVIIEKIPANKPGEYKSYRLSQPFGENIMFQYTLNNFRVNYYELRINGEDFYSSYIEGTILSNP